MKTKSYLVLVFVNILLLAACSKDTVKQQPGPQDHGFKSGLLTFSANGQLVDAMIDTAHDLILVTTKDTTGQSKLVINFTLQSQASASINGQNIINGATVDLTSPLNFTVTSADKSRSSTFKLVAETELGYIGMPGIVIAQNSLDKSYSYYFDQFDGSTWQSINCGPTSTTMAIKWADSTFTGKPLDARHMYLPQGGWWNTSQILAYLYDNGIDSQVDTLADFNGQIKNAIDKNNVVILNPDMNYIPYNETGYQHINKFYTTTPFWGHYILVKGYKQINSDFYLDVYDPFSEGQRYTSAFDMGQIKGQDRYYNAGDVRLSTKNWWPYAIIIAPKGKKVTNSIKLRINSLSKPIPISYGR